MEEYARIAIEEIERQWNKGINPAIYNGHEWQNAIKNKFVFLINFLYFYCD